jgi:hypothetical protein
VTSVLGMRLILWLCRGCLTLMLLTSAVGKARTLASFQEYLLPIFGSASRLVARGVVVAEIALACLLISWPSTWAGLIATSAVGLLTIFYAARFWFADSVRCACWGAGNQSEENQSLKDAALYPMLLALRNGLLAGGAVVLATARPHSTIEPQVLIPRILLIIASAQLIVLIGLSLSIGRKRRLLHATPHPLTASYAPRWARVRGCRSVEFDQLGQVMQE